MTDGDTDGPRTRSFAEQAARAGWIAPLLAVGLNMFVGRASGDRTVAIAIGSLAGVMILAGFVLSVWAIALGLTKGPRKVLVSGTVGLLLNGLLIALIVHTFIFVGEFARQRADDAAISSDGWIPEGDGWHVDREEGFAVRFPDDWEVLDEAYEGVAVVAISPVEHAGDGFRENTTVVVSRIPRQLDTAALFEANTRDMRDNIAGYDEESRGSLRVDGLDLLWVSYGQRVDGVATRAQTYMVAGNGRGYFLSCTATPGGMDRFRGQFETIVKSLRIARD